MGDVPDVVRHVGIPGVARVVLNAEKVGLGTLHDRFVLDEGKFGGLASDCRCMFRPVQHISPVLQCRFVALAEPPFGAEVEKALHGLRGAVYQPCALLLELYGGVEPL